MGQYSGSYWVGIPELTISRKLFFLSPTQRLNINCISTCTPFSILETQENPLLLALPNWEQYCHRRWAGLQCCPQLKMATGSPPPPHVANDRAFPGDRTCSDPTLLPAIYRMLMWPFDTRLIWPFDTRLMWPFDTRAHTVAAPSPRFVLPGSPPRQYRAPVLHIHTIRALLKQPQQRAQDALNSSTPPPKFVHTLFSSKLGTAGRGEATVQPRPHGGGGPRLALSLRRPTAAPPPPPPGPPPVLTAARPAASGQRPRARGPALPGLPAPPAWRQQAFELTNEAQNQRKTQNTFF